MTERRGDQGFSVAPRPIGDRPDGRRSRPRRWLGIALVLAAGAAVVAIAWLGPRLSGRPNFEVSFFATPTPAATPTPTAEPTPPLPVRATPLPEITRSEGAVPQGHVAIVADGLRILDLATGTIEGAAAANYGTDAIFRAPDGRGWTCVCFVDDVAADRPARTIRILEIGPDGTPADSSDVTSLPANFRSENGQPDPSTDLDIRADGRQGVLAVARPVGETWRFSVAAIDVDGRRAGPLVDLGVATAPGPSPGPSPQPSPAPTPDAEQPNQVFLDGPHVRIAPDGRIAFVWGTLQRATEDGGLAPTVHAWRVALDRNGSIGEVSGVPGLDRLPGFCNAVGFAASDRLAWLCPKVMYGESPAGELMTWVMGTIDLDGLPAGSVEIPLAPERFFSEPLFDRANARVYAWDPNGLTIVRIDVRTLATDTVTVDPAAEAAPGVAPGGGTARPEWRDADSAVQQYGFSQVAGGPDGSRLYALGFEQVAGSDATGSRGVFVLDRATLALVDRWGPAADYLGISVLPGGQVAATGMPGVDAQGHEAPWQGSLTIHDPADGRILVRFGQLGQDMLPLLVDR